MRSFLPAVAGAALLVACTEVPRPAPGPDLLLPATLRQSVTDPARGAMQAAPTAVMPATLRQTLTDPGRMAIDTTSSVFGNPRTVAGRPAAAADAVAELEWLTVNLATDQRWIGLPGNVPVQMRGGRDAVRAALGIPTDAATNAVIEALDATAAALRAGNRVDATAAIAAVTGQANAARAIGVLDALPSVPRAQQATAAAANGLAQMDVMTSGRNNR
jgi:hypothetical protein